MRNMVKKLPPGFASKKWIALVVICVLTAQAPLVYGEAEEKKEVPPLVESYFSPEDHVAERLITLISEETVSIKAAVYCLTHRGIIKALSNAKRRGVDVELIIDPFTIKARAPLRRMVQTGMKVLVWDPQWKQSTDKGKQREPLMHHKFCIFHSLGAVWTGSFNFTSEASNANQENAILLRDKKQMQLFESQFQEIKERGCRSYLDYLTRPKKKKEV
jgi:phosphatidylserine/phosphatidylglycerophosphate/cardiolipin synthase-like enzyme